MLIDIETRTDHLSFRSDYKTLQEALDDAKANPQITFITFSLFTGEKIELYKTSINDWIINGIYT